MNYLRIHNWVPFRSSFMYIDVPEYVADQIFEDHGLNVRFKDNELYHPEMDLIVAECTIATRDEELFFECMEHLKRKLTFLGYDMADYDTMSELFSLITEKYEDLMNEYN